MNFEVRRLMSTELVIQGLLLRNNAVHNAHIGAHWATSLLFSLIQELVDYYDPSEDHFNGKGLFRCYRCTDNSWLQSTMRLK